MFRDANKVMVTQITWLILSIFYFILSLYELNCLYHFGTGKDTNNN